MPIEQELIKKGINTDKNLSIFEKRNNCKQFAESQIERQKEQFARLGLECDMKDIYCTFDNDFEADQLRVFFKALDRGLVYQDLKPVY
jgi:isoleucyl-tRNA synthetase